MSNLPSLDMPIVRHKQSESARKRMEYLKYLATESPEPSYDLTKCELSEVPTGIYYLCKVLQKEVLLLSDNLLSSLSGGGNFKDLTMLRVLDLHNNKLTELPEALTGIPGLQVLNVENNSLKNLPSGIGKLQALQTLNARGNQLKELPVSVGQMTSLRTLDLSNNKLRNLPSILCHVRTLETLTLEGNAMKHPPAGICSQGTAAIMKYFCSECGIDYSPPAQHVLPLLDAPKVSPTDEKSTMKSLKADEDNLNNTIMQYEKMQGNKRLQRIRLEKEIEEMEMDQEKLMAHTNQQRRGLLKALEKEQADIDSDIKTVQERSELEKRQLVRKIHDVELHSTKLIAQLLEMNEKARQKEALLDHWERERMELDATFRVASEERALLREGDILKYMHIICNENFYLEELRNTYDKHRESIRKRAHDSDLANQEMVNARLYDKQLGSDAMVADLMKEEEFQRQAFEKLLLSKDAKHKRLTDEIYMLQQQLAEVTMAELQKQSVKTESTNIALEQKREDLAALLKQLMMEQEHREAELRNRLVEMEHRREDDIKDYWLIQFQHLMDRKPQALVDEENNLELSVIDILRCAGADDYIHRFARHRVSIESMVQLTDDDLKELGVHELGLRRSILARIKDYSLEMENASTKSKKLESDEAGPSTVPSAPSIDHEMGASSLPNDVTVRVNTECVVCMERDSDTLFFNCGHVCCCGSCSESLRLCPLCRGAIVTKVSMQRADHSVQSWCS